MTRPPVRFLTVDEVIEIHLDMITQHGGSPDLLSPALLESAVAQPQGAFAGQFHHSDLPSMAAAYLFHLAMNHPFADGNKRVAAKSAHVFLLMNDLDLALTSDQLADTTLAVASGQMSKPDLTTLFQKSVVPASDIEP